MNMPSSTMTPMPSTLRSTSPSNTVAGNKVGLWQKLGCLILTNDFKQRATIGVLLLTILFTAVQMCLLYYGTNLNIFEAGPLLKIATLWLTYLGIVYVIVRSGYNQYFAEKSLALPQTCVAQFFTVLAYGYTGAAHSAMLMSMSVIMVFGMFNMKERATCIACLYSLILLGMMMIYKSSTDPIRYPSDIEWIYFTISATSMLMISGLSVRMCHIRLRLKMKKRALEMAYRQVQELSTRDELTGLPNRRSLNCLLEQHVERHARTGQNFYVAMLDLDHFKRVNDTWGHHIGDEVLKNVSRYTCERLRKTDTIGRWGGEEFLLLLPETGMDVVPLGLGRLQLRVSGMPMSQNPPLFITFSAGLTKYRSGECIEQTLKRADQLLYQAKSRGRNQIMHDDVLNVKLGDTMQFATA